METVIGLFFSLGKCDFIKWDWDLVTGNWVKSVQNGNGMNIFWQDIIKVKIDNLLTSFSLILNQDLEQGKLMAAVNSREF